MLRKILASLIFLCIFLILATAPVVGEGEDEHFIYLPFIHKGWAITRKWQNAGCYSSWCETGWYSSPAVADVDGNGKNEVIASAYSLMALDGETGALIWRVGGTANRTWPGVVVADIDRDSRQEIIIAQGGGLVTAYNLDGTQKWRQQPAGNNSELRGLLVADLDGNSSNLEVVVTRAGGSATNTWVLDANGSTRAGWPQLSQTNVNQQNGYAWGVYNANPAAANIAGDSRLELIVPSDVHYINGYQPDGSLLPVNSAVYPNKTYWGQVGIWEDLEVEKRGWGLCNGVRAESFRANFADGPAVLADVNGDGQREVVVTGNMYNCISGYPSQYTAVFIFNVDRTRFKTGAYDWSTAPVDTGAPLSQDYNIIESAQSNPVVVDLDGDGKKEILFASYDGRLHAFWLDKTEHGSWPYAVTRPGEGVIRFASEPVVVDLENDGKAEVIFTSWPQKGSQKTGKLHILRWDGTPMIEIDLPMAFSASRSWNGAMAAPTLANIDDDPDLEIIINTANSGVVAYDIHGSANARVLWGTGRGNFQRDGSN
jgi:hypothetical protein